jgi:hypothetical protein
MRRRHLVELTDLPGCPRFVRRFITDYLRTAMRLVGAWRPMLPPLERLLRESGARRIVDLCSGGGGPLPSLRAALARRGLDVAVVLTDLFPDPTAAPPGFDYLAEPVDAARVPARLDGARTLFEGLHHFRPEAASAVLADAVHARAPIAVFETTERSVGALLSMLLVPLMVLLITPFIRPFKAHRLLLTWVVPLLPFAVLWDALVSCLRSYTVEELRRMGEAAGPGYAWEAGRSRHGALSITWLLGHPPTSEASHRAERGRADSSARSGGEG